MWGNQVVFNCSTSATPASKGLSVLWNWVKHSTVSLKVSQLLWEYGVSGPLLWGIWSQYNCSENFFILHAVSWCSSQCVLDFVRAAFCQRCVHSFMVYLSVASAGGSSFWWLEDIIIYFVHYLLVLCIHVAALSHSALLESILKIKTWQKLTRNTFFTSLQHIKIILFTSIFRQGRKSVCSNQ